MSNKLKFLIPLLLSALFVSQVHAAKRYWVSPSGTWNTAANWSSTSGGAGGSSVPGSSDTAYFDGGTGSGNCTINTAVNVKRFELTAGYAAAVSQGANTITVGTGNAVFSGGTFTGGSSTITIAGSMTISGCSFTSTSNVLTVSGDLSITSGSYTHNNGTIIFDTPNTTTGNFNLFRLGFIATTGGSFTIINTLTVNNNFRIDGSNTTIINTGTIDVKGNVVSTNTATGGGGNATITMTGSNNVNLTGSGVATQGCFPSVTINKSGGTASFVSVITVNGNWTYTTGTISLGSSTLVFNGTSTITGKHTLQNVTFTSSGIAVVFTLVSVDTITINGTLALEGSGGLTFNTGVINAKSTVQITNTGTGGGGSATLYISGTASPTLSGSGTVGQGNLPKVKINKSSGTLTLSNVISVANDWTWLAGTVSPTASTVVFTGTSTITGTLTLDNVSFNSSATTTYTIATGTTLTSTGTLTIDGTGSLTFNTGTIDAQGTVTITNSGTAGGGNATLKLSGTGSPTLTGSGTVGQGILPKVTIDKSSGTLSLASIISVGNNWTWIAGTVSAGTSTVVFIGQCKVTGTHTLKNVTYTSNSSVTDTIASGTTLTVDGTLTIAGSGAITFRLGTLNANGDVTITNTGTTGGGDALFVITGTGTQTLTGGTAGQGILPNFTISNSGGTLNIVNAVTSGGNWSWTAGTVSAGSSTVIFKGTKTITGSHTLNNVTFDGSATSIYTIAPGTILTIAGTMTINGSSAVTLTTGTIYALGDITVTNTSTSGGGSTTIVINGTSTQTLTGVLTALQGKLPNVTIDKATGVLGINTVTIAGDFIYDHGLVSTTGTIILSGTANLDGQEASGTALMTFNNIAISGNITLTGDIDLDNTLTIGSTATLSAGSHTIHIGGSWNNTNGTWNYGTSNVIFDGRTYRQIRKTGSPSFETFYNLTFNRGAGSQTLASPVTVLNILTLTHGHVKTTTTNYLLLVDDATLVGGGDTAYVHGPVRKTGNDAFIFPLGDTTLVDTAYHPLAMTAPSSATDQFEAIYFAHNQTLGDSLVDSLASISTCEYWTMDRKIGSSTPTLSVTWNKNSCNADDYDDLRMAEWNGVKWLDLGAASISVNDFQGTLTALLSPGYSISPTPILIGKKNVAKMYATLYRALDGGYYLVNNGALYFKYDEEYNDVDDQLTFNIYNQQHRIMTSSSGSFAILLTSDYGDNRFFINLLSCTATSSGYLPSGYYILEVINEKNEKWYLRFKNNVTIVPLCSGDVGEE